MKNSRNRQCQWIGASWRRYERMVMLYLRENPVFTGRQHKNDGVPTCRLAFKSRKQRIIVASALDGTE